MTAGSNEEGTWPEPSIAQRRAGEELCNDLAAQLADDLALPAIIAVGAEGEILEKSALALDAGGRPIPDAVLGDAVMQHFMSRVDESGAASPVAIGFVRVDVSPPDITTLDLESGLVQQWRAP